MGRLEGGVAEEEEAVLATEGGALTLRMRSTLMLATILIISMSPAEVRTQ